MMCEESLVILYKDIFNALPEVYIIAGGGSPRKYYRLKNNGKTVIGVVSDDIEENKRFLRLDSCLAKAGINVPEVIKVNSKYNAYLIQDLGDTSLFSLLSGDNKIELARKALRELIKIQTLDPDKWENEVGYKPFSERLVKWDLNYFKYDFLKPSDIAFDEDVLEDDFERLTAKLTSTKMVKGLMYRDFQSRNIIVYEDRLWFIDFQGARKGPLAYDAASFIWQAKAPFTFEEREELEIFYCDLLSNKTGVECKEIRNQLKLMTLFRNLQVLGAYGFRGLIEHKAHFIQSIPNAVSNLCYLRQQGVLKSYGEIENISLQLEKKYLDRISDQSSSGKLVISVLSFSYKKGYPKDLSGNGGGFMFDCRAIHNPGRYDEYKVLTGRDREVIDFLEHTDHANEFIEKAIDIVTPSIKKYVERGFTSLQVGFGCTGGKHRSVYCAEKFSRCIAKKFPEVKVILNHREQEIIEKI